MENLLIGVIIIILNLLTIVLTVARVQIKNREDITRLETHVDNLQDEVKAMKGENNEM